MQSNKGFTIVELLVVISIIALLLAIMLPSLTRARKQAEQVHCLSNQRQLVLAWTMYAQHNDDRLCDPNLYVPRLKPYAKDWKVFVCKSVKGSDRYAPISDANALTRAPMNPQEISACFCRAMRLQGSESGQAMLANYGLSNTMGGDSMDGVRPYAKSHHIQQPAKRLLLIDIDPQSNANFWPLVREEENWFWRPQSWPINLQGMTARHSNGSNISYADGHGTYSRWRDKRTLDWIEGILESPAEASENNQDLMTMVNRLTRD